MPFILYPDIPPYPGVPTLVRNPGAAVADNPILAIGIGTVQGILANLFQQSPTWGIFTKQGLPLGQIGNGSANDLIQTIFAQPPGRTSVYTFDFAREMRVSDFPVELGSFAAYNKVQVAANPTVTMIVEGDESERSNFLNILDTATRSTDLFTIVTPEVQYINYTIERYTYQRAAAKGATLLMIDVTLREIRQVSASLTQVSSPIVQPQNAGATPTVNNGQVQPEQSTLLKGINAGKKLLGGN